VIVSTSVTKMTKMNIRIFILAVLLSTSNCGSKTFVDYADSLKHCMTDKDIALLNEACQIFEIQLTNRYIGQEPGQAYKAFLQDIQEMDIPQSFFVTSESRDILEKLRKSGTFDKIWTTLSSIESFDDIEIATTSESKIKAQAQYDPYCTNPDGSYFACITKQNNSKVIRAYLETMKIVPGLSPGHTARILTEFLKDDNFDNEMIRLILAVNFYYEMALMFERE